MMRLCVDMQPMAFVPVFLPLQGHQGSHRVEICRPALCPEISDMARTFSFQPFQPGRNWRVGASISESVAALYRNTKRFVALFCKKYVGTTEPGTLLHQLHHWPRGLDMLRDPNFVLVSTPEYASEPEFTQLDVHLS